jgi:hypothetical protein
MLSTHLVLSLKRIFTIVAEDASIIKSLTKEYVQVFNALSTHFIFQKYCQSDKSSEKV